MIYGFKEWCFGGLFMEELVPSEILIAQKSLDENTLLLKQTTASLRKASFCVSLHINKRQPLLFLRSWVSVKDILLWTELMSREAALCAPSVSVVWKSHFQKWLVSGRLWTKHCLLIDKRGEEMVAERRTNRPSGEESDMQAPQGHGSIRQTKSQISPRGTIAPSLSPQLEVIKPNTVRLILTNGSRYGVCVCCFKLVPAMVI